MSLEEYHKKRNFAKTSEPTGDVKLGEGQEKLKTGEGTKSPPRFGIYVIQEHHASHLHWDLRLEIGGVLRSWAVPKEPPPEPGIKRLAVETEDHPLEYANFEGIISEGLYGAGIVKIWDRGTFKPEKIEDNELIFEVFGKKLKGRYVLIRTKFQGETKNWLFFKKK